MTDRPIIFSAPMVRAILAGDKTQTRRLVTPGTSDASRAEFSSLDFTRAWADPGLGSGAYLKAPRADEADGIDRVRCRISIGDRLWVRETWARTSDGDVLYRERGDRWPYAWRPSIFMRRSESRITLDVTDVRVERLQSITEADARAEGCSGHDPEPVSEGGTIYAMKGASSAPSPRAHFMHLWDSINAKRAPWSENPWVWAISFQRRGMGT